MAATPTTEPRTIQAGDTLTWTKSLADWPAPTWTLSYTLLNASQRYTFSATADGTAHAVSVAAATTATWAAAEYTLIGAVTDGSTVTTVTHVPVTVRPPATAAVDTRTPLRKELDTLDAWYAGERSAGISEKSIGQRALRYWDPGELLAYYQKVKAAVAQEEAAAQLASGLPPKAARVLMRF